MSKDVKTITIPSDYIMAEGRRAEKILSQYYESVLVSLLGKSTIFISRSREKEATIGSIIVHQSSKVVLFCSITFLELQWQLNHLLSLQPSSGVLLVTPNCWLVLPTEWEYCNGQNYFLPTSFLQFFQGSNIAIGALCLHIVLSKIMALKAWEANVGILLIAQNVYSISSPRTEEITKAWFCFLGTEYRLKRYLSNNCHNPPF